MSVPFSTAVASFVSVLDRARTNPLVMPNVKRASKAVVSHLRFVFIGFVPFCAYDGTRVIQYC